MATKEIGTQIAHEDAIAASLKAIGLHPVEVLEKISKSGLEKVDCRLLNPADMPTAREALVTLRNRVKDEKRIDSTVDIKDLVMATDGRLARRNPNNPTAPVNYRTYTRHALCQIASRLPFHPAYAGPYWASIPGPRRASEFRATIQENIEKECAEYRLTIRLRRPPLENQHYIYAAVSERYTKYDPDQMSDDVLKALDADADTIRCNVYYNGLRTSIRLVLTNLAGFGVLAHLSTADDGTASINVGAELLLPSGATYAGKMGMHVSHRHIGGAHTVEDIQAALEKIDEVVQPWITLWTDAGSVELPLPLDKTVQLLTGDTETATKRGAFVKVTDMTPKQLCGFVLKVLAQGERGEITGFKPKATQAGLAELFLVAAGLADTQAIQQALQVAGEAVVSMSAAVLGRWLLGKGKKGRWEIAPENQALAEQIANMARGEADKWYKRAEAAEAAGDEEGAAVARERAEMRLVEGDLLQEKGIAEEPEFKF